MADRCGYLLEAELNPYREGARSITLQGPDVWLDSRGFSVMALVLHEMSTNAAKYGALSVNTGVLKISWSRSAEHDCELLWEEKGGRKRDTASPCRIRHGADRPQHSL